VNIDLQGFITNFSEQFDDTDAEEFRADTVFKDLDEWSSMIALSIIAMIDEEYGVTIRGNDIRAATTVEDLYNTVKGYKT
jgi:acyl carrier protein